MGKQLFKDKNKKRLIRAKCCFMSLCTIYKDLLNHKNDFEIVKTMLHYMEREFYEAVFSSPHIDTGLYTIPGDKTKDHYMSPQICSNFIFDYADVLLNDFEKFFELFKLNCRVIITDSKTNYLIRESKKNNNFTSEESYEKSNIDLYYKGEKVLNHKKALAIPKIITEWEKGFKTNDFNLHVNPVFEIPNQYKLGVLPV